MRAQQFPFFPLRLLLLLTALALTVAAPAQEAERPDLETRIAEWEAVNERASTALANDFRGRDLESVKGDLREMISAAAAARRSAEARLAAAEQQLESLGEPPGEDAPPENARIAELRAQMQRDASRHEAMATEARLVEENGEKLLQEIAAWERARFRAAILERKPAPVWPSVWLAAGRDGVALAAEVISAPLRWWQARVEAGTSWQQLALVGGVALGGLLLAWPLRLWLLRRYGRDPEDTDPSYARRLIAALADGLANAVLPVVVLAAVLLVLAWQGLMTGLFGLMAYTVGGAVAGFVLVLGVARAALSPHRIAWRILPVRPEHIGALLTAIRLLTAVMAVSLTVLVTAFFSGHMTDALEATVFLASTTAVAILAGWILSPRFWTVSVEASQEASAEGAETDATAAASEPPADAREARSWPDRIRGLVRLVVMAAPLLALAGFGRLAFFVQSRLLGLGLIAALAVLLRLAAREMLERFFMRRRRQFGLSGDTTEGGVRIAVFWAGFVLDLLLLLPIAYAVMLLFGVPLTTITLWTTQLLTGISIGNFTLSLADLIAAITVLVTGLFLTNLFRRWLSNRVLPHTRLDIGARNSVAAGAGYLGVGLALVLAVATLGVDFSNLAIVAGALSVGIGFGLQNVVQNFAAGLLLLIERPIKVGDWIIVGGNEGTVKHISVRSTEIETFDRSSVIVPNSDLISLPVTNWTHKNRIARVIVPVRVAYGSDTAAVAETLHRCARENRDVLRHPAPTALFLGFGDSCLNFELRCFIGDTDRYLDVRSDLHFAVDQAFREAGIVMPFPQRDVHLQGGQDHGPPPGTTSAPSRPAGASGGGPESGDAPE
ncbi:mechanosensitive ion channel domain-containing protein [Spiribacter halobius]|uniref:DUF3772 domain-containing protein n=1 Tax=Sediminicurvatus halobius TaxID=2182432 RepID=A0A2U2N8Y0_9GAMM|nr:mechanosensitive ion channel domain-containing protein [Spiribacter halobius]PWG65414.1 hypothetical protein DEM34_01330 [Spiribacter halobius]UEX76433.1 mechanosensitive ion channel [Spiribacter halobius]